MLSAQSWHHPTEAKQLPIVSLYHPTESEPDAGTWSCICQHSLALHCNLAKKFQTTHSLGYSYKGNGRYSASAESNGCLSLIVHCKAFWGSKLWDTKERLADESKNAEISINLWFYWKHSNLSFEGSEIRVTKLFSQLHYVYCYYLVLKTFLIVQ